MQEFIFAMANCKQVLETAPQVTFNALKEKGKPLLAITSNIAFIGAHTLGSHLQQPGCGIPTPPSSPAWAHELAEKMVVEGGCTSLQAIKEMPPIQSGVLCGGLLCGVPIIAILVGPLLFSGKRKSRD